MQDSNITDSFQSPTYGQVDFAEVITKIVDYVESDPEYPYRLIVGTDSQLKNGTGADFVTAIIIHRVGAGAIYFWQRQNKNHQYVLRQRIYDEALMSLSAADNLVTAFGRENGLMKHLEIHVDVGQQGPTREIIAEVVGMIRGNGFNVKIKPDAYGAAKVADRHT